jgi:hypothetical protein
MNRRQITAGIIVGMLLVVVADGVYSQDKKREPALRTVRGSVVDKDENTIAGGVVYLKNLKSNTVRTHIADNDGQYRFSGLDPNVDYEIHAEHADQASAKRSISSFDTRKEIVIHLKVNKKKE